MHEVAHLPAILEDLRRRQHDVDRHDLGAQGGRRLLASVGAGLVPGLFLSYGLVLMALIAVAVLLAARTWRSLVPAVLAALAVVGAFAAAGFWWVEGERTLVVVCYYQGAGSDPSMFVKPGEV